MKKEFSFLVMLLFVGLTNVIAQTAPVFNNSRPEEHLEFKGIEITGTIDNVIEKLKKAGYTLAEKDEDGAVLDGTFANEDCQLLVSLTPKTKKVYSISVFFNKKDSWYSLKADYKELKQSLKNKYDIRPDDDEFFIDPYYEGDGYELQALRLSKCIYRSKYELNDGEITLAILSNRIVLIYEDKKGDEINEREKSQNAYDDL